MSDKGIIQQMVGAVVAGVRSYREILASIGWIILFFVLQVITGVIAVGIAIGMHPSKSPITQRMQDLKLIAVPTIWSLVAASLILLGLLHFYLRKQDRYAQIGLKRWSNLPATRTILLGIVVSAIGIGFNYIYAGFIIPDVKVQDQLHQLFAAIPDTWFNGILLFTAVAIIAPITEEILFRGLLQNGLKTKMPAWTAIVIAALVFALVHLDPAAMPALFVLGASFGVLYEKTGSLRVNILMHMLNNAAAMLLTGGN